MVRPQDALAFIVWVTTFYLYRFLKISGHGLDEMDNLVGGSALGQSVVPHIGGKNNVGSPRAAGLHSGWASQYPHPPGTVNTFLTELESWPEDLILVLYRHPNTLSPLLKRHQTCYAGGCSSSQHLQTFLCPFITYPQPEPALLSDYPCVLF